MRMSGKFRDNRANDAKRAPVRFDFSAFTVIDHFHREIERREVTANAAMP